VSQTLPSTLAVKSFVSTSPVLPSTVLSARRCKHVTIEIKADQPKSMLCRPGPGGSWLAYVAQVKHPPDSLPPTADLIRSWPGGHLVWLSCCPMTIMLCNLGAQIVNAEVQRPVKPAFRLDPSRRLILRELAKDERLEGERFVV